MRQESTCVAYPTAPPIQKAATIPLVLDEITKLACELRNACEQAADNLSGNIGNECCDPKGAPSPSYIQGVLVGIRLILEDAHRQQRRVMEVLAL